MKMKLGAEQLEVASVASKFLVHELPLTRVRTLADDSTKALAIDNPTWQRCADMGWLALGVPESKGGVGFGPVEEFVLFRELGRYLAPGPFISTVIAGWVAAGSGTVDLATELFEGRRRAGLAVGEFLFDAEPNGLAVVVDGSGAAIRSVGEIDPVVSVDASVRLSRGALGPNLAELNDPRVLSRAQILVSAMELGNAEATRDMSVEYAKLRMQFGKPIGTFQAVKHRCSDMAIRAHAAHAQTMFAAFHVERDADDSRFHAASAKLVATKAAKLNAADNVQNHGAIGFTVEHDAGLFARRAHMLEFALGGQMVAVPSALDPARHEFETLPALAADWADPTS